MFAGLSWACTVSSGLPQLGHVDNLGHHIRQRQVAAVISTLHCCTDRAYLNRANIAVRDPPQQVNGRFLCLLIFTSSVILRGEPPTSTQSLTVLSPPIPILTTRWRHRYFSTAARGGYFVRSRNPSNYYLDPELLDFSDLTGRGVRNPL